MGTTRLPTLPRWLLLGGLFALGVWFLSNELVYAITRDRAGEGALRNIALIAHLSFATPLLLLPIFQFSPRIRTRWPVMHRRVGWLYLVSAILASSIAIYLGMTFDSLGRRVPVTIFALAWLLFSIAALVCARRRMFIAHEQFVIRSYAMALAFVFVRVMGAAENSILAFLPSAELRGVTREWLCFVLPLIVVEAWISWWPTLRKAIA